MIYNITALLQINESGEIKIPLDIVIQSGMHPGEYIETTIHDNMLIIKRSHKDISPTDQDFNDKKDDSRTWDPSAYYGSLNHVFQRRKADIIARELRDEWDKI